MLTMGWSGRICALIGGIVLSATILEGARAQTPADVAAISGPDRMQKLIDGAKRENALSLYTSSSPEDMSVIAGAFEKKYGVKAKIWRGSSSEMLQRALNENRAGRAEVDTYETTGPTMEVFHREGLLQRIDTPSSAQLMPQASFPHKEWVASRLNTFVPAFNTNVFRKADAPKAWEDFLDPKYKGKLSIEDTAVDWFASVVSDMGEEKGLRLFKDIVARNGISPRRGNTLLANMIAAGEAPASLTSYENVVLRMKEGGAPVDISYVSPVFSTPTGIGVSKKAPHPHAAVLFFEFMLTDGQKLYFERGVNPTNISIKPLPAGVDMKFVNFPEIMDHLERWTKLFKETFSARR